jgi:ATP-dependent protease ClpP protease subunit
MKYLVLLLMLLIGCGRPAPTIPEDVLAELQANSQMMFNLSGDITSSTANMFVSYVEKKAIGETVLIYINTNGGDVNAAEKIMNAMTRQKTVCIADTAISAGFEIFQSCTLRIYIDRTVLMAHRHWTTFSGPITMPELLMAGLDGYIQETYLLTKCAHRMEMSYSELVGMIEKKGGEWYIYGKDIMKYNAADYHLKDYQLTINKR